MKVTLNIENDAELRAYIKDCIQGQVLSIVRDEFLQIVTQELERKIKATSSLNFERMLKDALNKSCSDILYKDHKVDKWNDSFIKPIVSVLVSDAIKGKDWNAIVDALAKEKIKSLIK